jgi:ribosomal protein S3
VKVWIFKGEVLDKAVAAEAAAAPSGPGRSA